MALYRSPLTVTCGLHRFEEVRITFHEPIKRTSQNRFDVDRSTLHGGHSVEPGFESVIGSWLACHEFEPSTFKDPQGRLAMHVKSVQSSKYSHYCGVVIRRGGASSGFVLVISPWFQMTRSAAKCPCVAELCHVNIHSLIQSRENNHETFAAVFC
ncbi:hypothetical protein TNCV_150261 [Trichonephila clavipes]|nr:hypothetical protein TNCV_150261 [Trichonephila clavipes]